MLRKIIVGIFMETVKSRIFNYLSSSQKAEICHYISTFTKKHFEKSEDVILELFIEEEKYYLNVSSSRHSWIKEYIENDDFIKDLTLFIRENIKKIKIYNQQSALRQKQKEFQKEQRKKIQNNKLSKLPPTQSQIAYYKALCKRYNIDINSLDLKNASKFELKEAIDALLTKKYKADKEKILQKLNEIIKSRKS